MTGHKAKQNPLLAKKFCDQSLPLHCYCSCLNSSGYRNPAGKDLYTGQLCLTVDLLLIIK